MTMDALVATKRDDAPRPEGSRVCALQSFDCVEVLEERHGRRSIIVTSQIPVDRWHDLIGDPTYADAILDRLVHNAHRINLGGESLRKGRTGAASS